MDEKKLKELLNSDIEQPSEEVQKRAISSAMAEFDQVQEKNKKTSKGSSWWRRLMGISETYNGDLTMKNYKFRPSYAMGMLAVGVAVVAITNNVVRNEPDIARYNGAVSYDSKGRALDETIGKALVEVPNSRGAFSFFDSKKKEDKKIIAEEKEEVATEMSSLSDIGAITKNKPVPKLEPSSPSSKSFDAKLIPNKFSKSKESEKREVFKNNRVDSRLEGDLRSRGSKDANGLDETIGTAIMAENKELPGSPKPPKSITAQDLGPPLSYLPNFPGYKSRAKQKSLSQAESQRRQIVGGGVSLDVVRGNIIAGEYWQPQLTPIAKLNRDKFDEIKVNQVKSVSSEPVSTFSIDVDTASYSFVRKQINSGVLPQKNAVRVEEMVNYFNYNYELPEDKSEPFKPTIAVYPTPWNADTKLVHIGIKGYDLDDDSKPRANLVFLIDVSGSMTSQNKLPLVQKSLKMMLDSLDPEDTVGLVVYAGAAGTVLEPTKVRNKEVILSAIENLRAGGSTAGGAGIKLAYNLAQQNFDDESVNRVILATDGDFNVGATSNEDLKRLIERKRKTGIFLSILGFGQGNLNDSLMQTLAQNGNGNAAYIDSLNEARKVLVEEAGSTLFTIAKDVKIQVEFNPTLISEYRLIGYESRMLKREDFNNDKIDAGEVGAGHAVTAIYEVTPFGSETMRVDNLRYAEEVEVRKPVTDKNYGSEYAFLKIRHKLPDASKSTLMTREITKKDEYESVDDLPTDLRFAASVSAFGQVLRNDPYVSDFSYEDVIKLAKDSRGKDEFGYRSEFLNLVRLAKALD